MNTTALAATTTKFDPLQVFAPLTLKELDNQAELMDRQDHKYVHSVEHIMAALAKQASCYRILEINNKRSFTYENHYFDSEDFACFHEHQQGKRKRFKVRTRFYADSGICFLELKLKGPRNSTIKSRIPHQADKRDRLDHKAMAFITQSYETSYGHPFEFELKYAMTTAYQRTTLVSTLGAERLTIDSQLAFTDQLHDYQLNPGRSIVETKSTKINRSREKVIRAMAQQPISACSKYCVGLALLGKVKRYNRFNQAIRKLTE